MENNQNEIDEKGFNLLAIRPLNGTAKRFIKNLQPQVIYKFHQTYKFSDETGIEILETNKNLETINVFPELSDIPEINLYSSNGLNINVSAIVGKNGSGKSSIIDFYDLIIYHLSCTTLDKMFPANTQTFNDIKLFAHFVKEYLSQLQNFIEPDFLEKRIASSKPTKQLNYFELKNLVQDLISIFEVKNISHFLDIKDLSTESQLSFQNLLWRYSLEGKEHHKLNIPHSFHQIQYVYQALNKSIIERFKKLISQFEAESHIEQLLSDEFNFQLFYKKDNHVHCIHKQGKYTCIYETDLFYTILLNYSLHSMNSEHLGNWIFKLFHKNDGYQTPIVINPYREHGVIDVNSELELSTDRLIYNVVDQFRSKNSASILDKYHFKKIILTLKTTSPYPINKLLEENVDYRNKIELVDYLPNDPLLSIAKKDAGILDYCMRYLFKKFRKISTTYMNHFYEKQEYTEKELSKQLDELGEWQISQAKKFILKANSHVTRKFDQTYNFILNYDLLVEKLFFLKNWDLNQNIEITADQLDEWINLVEDIFDLKPTGTHEIINHLFPTIFKIDLEFENNGSPIKLSDMSSGEQQYIFNINTITYHINNLKTVKPIEDGKISKYSHVNIILDEIELYYHPQYQKQLVKDLITEIKSIDSLGELQNFNIQFLTHSPFILSDIPTQNILRLDLNEEGKSEPQPIKDQTFGANIHDLLANDFFLKKGFMGEFAKEKIADLITYLNPDSKENSKLEWTETSSKELISIIGEPILKMKLAEMHDEKFKKNLEIELLQKRIDEIKGNKA